MGEFQDFDNLLADLTAALDDPVVAPTPSTPNPQPASETRTIDFDKLPKVNIPPRQPQSVPEISSPVATSATTQTAQPMSPRSAAAARAAATPTRKSSVVVKPEPAYIPPAEVLVTATPTPTPIPAPVPAPAQAPPTQAQAQPPLRAPSLAPTATAFGYSSWDQTPVGLLLVQLKLAQYGQALFDEGVEEVEDLTAYTGWAGLGVKPFHKEKIINAANSPADTAPSRPTRPPAASVAPIPNVEPLSQARDAPAPIPELSPRATSPVFKCERCKKVLTEMYIIALDKYWHAECFTCVSCHKALDGSFFDTEHGVVCDSCAQSKFVCCECGRAIDGEHLVFDDGRVVHKTCAPAKPCGRCGQTLLLTNPHIEALEMFFHPSCFTCSRCDSPLGTQFICLENEQFCNDCIKQIEKERNVVINVKSM